MAYLVLLPGLLLLLLLLQCIQASVKQHRSRFMSLSIVPLLSLIQVRVMTLPLKMCSIALDTILSATFFVDMIRTSIYSNTSRMPDQRQWAKWYQRASRAVKATFSRQPTFVSLPQRECTTWRRLHEPTLQRIGHD